jgi:hypothetical protein
VPSGPGAARVNNQGRWLIIWNYRSRMSKATGGGTKKYFRVVYYYLHTCHHMLVSLRSLVRSGRTGCICRYVLGHTWASTLGREIGRGVLHPDNGPGPSDRAKYYTKYSCHPPHQPLLRLEPSDLPLKNQDLRSQPCTCPCQSRQSSTPLRAE